MTPLEQEQVDEVYQLSQALSRACQASITPILLELDLSMVQLKTLFILARENPITIGQVAERLGIGIPSASYQVDKVVQAGLVRRTEDTTDRRRTLTFLTPAGEELMRQLFQGREEQFRFWIGQMNPADLASLLQGLKAIVRITTTSAGSNSLCSDTSERLG
ncbi:MAG: MarR family transcriptional regulator [Chloroflexota bacterium]|nr:MarR family transcriptional regulator [Chloroflexota bacterium]